MVNENDHIRHLGHISHLTVLFFSFQLSTSTNERRKRNLGTFCRSCECLFPCDCLNSLSAFSQCKINSPQSAFYTAFFAIIYASLGYANNLFCLLAFFLIYQFTMMNTSTFKEVFTASIKVLYLNNTISLSLTIMIIY